MERSSLPGNWSRAISVADLTASSSAEPTSGKSHALLVFDDGAVLT
jgi:hypothetical protein